MARPIEQLSALEVRNAKPEQGRTAALLADGGNLYLQCTIGEDGAVRRSWVFRYELGGRRREMGLGPLKTMGLAEARDKARNLRQQLLENIDPLDARQKAKLAKLAEQARMITFKKCAEMYLALHQDGWRNPKHRQQWTSTLKTYAYPIIGELAVDAVDSASILKIVAPLWGVKTETAARIRGRIEAIIDYATAAGFRSGDNPARHIAASLPKRAKVQKVEHHPALPYLDVPAFMAELRRCESVSARCLEFTILTAVRTGEAIGATWDEIDLKAKTWTIPAERMKAEKEHKVPLTARAIEILGALPRHGQHVFSASRKGGPLSNMSMLKMLRRLRPGITVHGFRSSFRDWCAEMTNFPNHVVEMALAHAVGGKVEAAYRRGDLFEKRRRLMAAWTDYCAKPAPTGATVMHLRKVGADV